jgi:hypothetical protein
LVTDWSRGIVCDDPQLEPSVYAPGLSQLWELLATIVEQNGPQAFTEQIISLIHGSGHFVDDCHVQYPVRPPSRSVSVDVAQKEGSGYSFLSVGASPPRKTPP